MGATRNALLLQQVRQQRFAEIEAGLPNLRFPEHATKERQLTQMRCIAERIPERLAVSTVIGDGSCGLHAIARIMQDAVNAQLTEHEIRCELGHLMRGPAGREWVQQEVFSSATVGAL